MLHLSDINNSVGVWYLAYNIFTYSRFVNHVVCSDIHGVLHRSLRNLSTFICNHLMKQADIYFWCEASCSLVHMNQRFMEPFSFHYRKQQVPPKWRLLSTRLHGATSQKTVIFMLVAVRSRLHGAISQKVLSRLHRTVYTKAFQWTTSIAPYPVWQAVSGQGKDAYTLKVLNVYLISYR